MTKNPDNIRDCEISEAISCKEVLYLALENLEYSNKEYFDFIKKYILNYEKTDTKIRYRLKKIIIFIQDNIKSHGEKATLKTINKKLDKLGILKNKDIYSRLYLACIKYSETDITSD